MSQFVAISKDPNVFNWRAKQFADTPRNGTSEFFFIENNKIRGKSASRSRCRSQKSNPGNFEKTRVLNTRK